MQNTLGHLILSCEPCGCSHDAFQSVFGVGRGCGGPHSDRGAEDSLDGSSVELGVNFQGDHTLLSVSSLEKNVL